MENELLLWRKKGNYYCFNVTEQHPQDERTDGAEQHSWRDRADGAEQEWQDNTKKEKKESLRAKEERQG